MKHSFIYQLYVYWSTYIPTTGFHKTTLEVSPTTAKRTLRTSKEAILSHSHLLLFTFTTTRTTRTTTNISHIKQTIHRMSKCVGTKTYNVYSKVIIRVQANKKKKKHESIMITSRPSSQNLVLGQSQHGQHRSFRSVGKSQARNRGLVPSISDS